MTATNAFVKTILLSTLLLAGRPPAQERWPFEMVKIMAGSDTPELFLLYGFTLHRELKNLVEAGLTPYAALEAATRVPAEFLNTLGEAGVIGRGKRADLVLLEANPLEDISNTEKRAGVMARGRWMPEAELKKTLDEIAPRFQAVSGAER
jgi:cytosine/adenosine deaminase-related metal-dependent hydrolase